MIILLFGPPLAAFLGGWADVFGEVRNLGPVGDIFGRFNAIALGAVVYPRPD